MESVIDNRTQLTIICDHFYFRFIGRCSIVTRQIHATTSQRIHFHSLKKKRNLRRKKTQMNHQMQFGWRTRQNRIILMPTTYNNIFSSHFSFIFFGRIVWLFVPFYVLRIIQFKCRLSSTTATVKCVSVCVLLVSWIGVSYATMFRNQAITSEYLFIFFLKKTETNAWIRRSREEGTRIWSCRHCSFIR